MEHLDTMQLIALAAALGWASGIRLYAVLFVVGAVGFAGWVEIPEHLRVLSHPLVPCWLWSPEFFARLASFGGIWCLIASSRCGPAVSVFGDSPPVITAPRSWWSAHRRSPGGRLAINSADVELGGVVQRFRSIASISRSRVSRALACAGAAGLASVPVGGAVGEMSGASVRPATARQSFGDGKIGDV
jgi:hypothetical protein